MQGGEALLHQLDKAPDRAEVDVRVEGRVVAGSAEAAQRVVAVVSHDDIHPAGPGGRQHLGELAVALAFVPRPDPHPLGQDQPVTQIGLHQDFLAPDVRMDDPLDVDPATGHRHGRVVEDEGVRQLKVRRALRRLGLGLGRRGGRRRRRRRGRGRGGRGRGGARGLRSAVGRGDRRRNEQERGEQRE